MKRLISFAFIICLFVCFSCEREHDAADGQYASLTLSLDIPDYGGTVESKGITDGIDPTGWSDADKLKDGRIMDRMFLGLIDDSGRLAGYRLFYKGAADIDDSNGFIPEGNTDIAQDSEYGYKASANFSYDSPKRPAELLRIGTYTVFVIANYSGYSDVETLISNIVNSFDQYYGISGFASSKTWSDLKNFSYAPENGIYNGERMPLSVVKKVYLSPGDNNLEIELLRQFARIRFEIRNYSSKEMHINDFYLGNNFSQESSYLLWNQDDPSAVYNSDYFVPAVTDTKALTPYSELPEGYKALPGNSMTVLFDGFICESRHDDPYKYRLEIEYPSVTEYLRVKPSETEIIKSISDMTSDLSIGEEGYFAIRHYSSPDRTISENTTSNQIVIPKNRNITFDCLKNDFSGIWKIKRTDENVYQISNFLTGRYMHSGEGKATQNDMSTTKDPHNMSLTDGSNGLLISKKDTDLYLNIHGGVNNTTIGTWDSNKDTGSMFWFIPCDIKEDPSFKEDIVLSTIDPVTAIISQAREIARNDYVSVMIETYYNENSCIFKYEVVIDWSAGGGNIVFN